MNGKPVIARESGGIIDAVHHQETGWSVPAGDVNEFSAKIRHLALDATLYRQLAVAG